MAPGNPYPESIALVLWGTDNLKTEGGPIGQALALLGARPRFDAYGRIAGATLVPLEELGRPRIDVMVTLSGIFRDLLPLQIKLIAEAAYPGRVGGRAARAKLRAQARPALPAKSTAAIWKPRRCACTAMPRAPMARNVNHLVENGRWDDEDELAETYTRRKSFAYGRSGRAGAADRSC